MIDRAKIEGQIATFEKQQADLQATYAQCEGGLKLCRFWLAELDRQETANEAAAAARANGVQVPVSLSTASAVEEAASRLTNAAKEALTNALAEQN